MATLEDVKQGWEYMSKILGADIGSNSAFQDFTFELNANEQVNIANANIANQNAQIDIDNARIESINRVIDDLSRSVNEHPHTGLDIEQLKGYVAEEVHAATFNIDAIRHGSEHRAFTLQSNAEASVDIGTNFGDEYSLKYYNYADKAEGAQAVLSKDGSAPKYQGQKRLIADEQVEEAKAWANRRALRNDSIRTEVAEAHRETRDNLVGVVSDDEGNKSKPLSIKESKEIASEAKRGEFNPETHGIEKGEKREYIPFQDAVSVDYLQRALEAGVTAAAITAATQIVPELYKAIDYLIKNGQIDLNQIKKSGKRVITSSGESFLRGSIAYGVELMIQNGVLGENIKSVPPTVVGTVVTIILGTVKNSILFAAGKMTPTEMGMRFVDTIVISAGYAVGAKVGGVIAQMFFPQIPGVAYAIGSLLGCAIAVVYNIGKKKLISFCVDTGFTCFGLVEQSYELPSEVLHQLGIDTIPINTTDVPTTQVNRTDVLGTVNKTQYETINLTILKRGVIGVNKIGYVF